MDVRLKPLDSLHLSIFLCCTLISLISCSNDPDGQHVSEVRGYNKREHSLVKPYQGSGMSIPFWDIVGDTIVTPQYVRLTPDDKSRHGGLWNQVPVRSRDWELFVTHNVHGTKGDLYGDGLAIWYAKERAIIGPVFGGPDRFHGVAIFLDTYSNHNGPHNHAHPYVSAMVNNGTLSYDHDTDGTHTQIAGCESKFRNKDYDTNILIRYAEDTLSVYQDVMNLGTWKLCFSVPGITLPTGYYFGMSAATGDLSDNHDILTVKMYELEIPRPEKKNEENREHLMPHAQSYAAPRDHIPDAPPPTSGFKTTLWVILALAIVGGLLFAGVLMFQKRQEQSRKRFY